MNIVVGEQVGAYQITAFIGEGGMGRVFRARDTRLKRDVAIKALPDAFALDADRIARFHREAEALASLNHPHIAGIHDLVEADGSQFLVLELVEGETLADRIRRGPLEVDDALDVAKQIADALEAAHERGIVHRDLKPANVKLTDDGTVKVLDFGLAKLGVGWAGSEGTAGQHRVGSGRPQPDVTASPTLTAMSAGMILGTAAYMSPEQAKGRETDRTSDVWAFGCVLYEMLTGCRVFRGETVSELVAEVLKTEPDWHRLPGETPPAIRRLLRLCLQKDRRQRLKDIGDARLQVEEALNEAGTASPSSLQKPRRAERWAWTTAGVLGVIAILAIGWAVRPTAPPPELRVEITTPASPDLVSLALAPDGQTLVYVAAVDGISRLWLRPLGAGSARPLAETDGAAYPFWSPDSTSIGFFADGKLKRINVGGAAPQNLAFAGAGRGGTWNRDGVILFAPNAVSQIYRVSAGGGQAVPVTSVQRPQQTSHRLPVFLPDGRHFLFYSTGVPDARGVYIASLDGAETVRLCDADSGAVLGPFRHLMFVRQNTLFAHQLDLDRLALVGSPVTIATSVAVNAETNAAALSASDVRSIVYRPGAASAARQFLWFDRTGTKVGEVGSPDLESPLDPELSPDGRRLAMTRVASGNSDVWLMDVARGLLGRFTVDPAVDLYPVWSSDGSRLAFSSSRKGVFDLYQRASSGDGAEETLFASAANKLLLDWSHDERFVLYRSVDPKTGANRLWALPLAGDGKPFPIVGSSFEERDGQFSPDGKWIAYRSNESGRFEVYVQAFPAPKGKSQVSTTGGSQPRWRRDGKEIFYIGLDGKLMAAPVHPNPMGPSVDVGTVAALFPTRIFGGAFPGARKHQYAVSADGQRFLINSTVDESAPPPITLIFNWKPPSAK